MAWFSPDPLLLPDILALNSRWLRRKPALIVDDATSSWAAFGDATARAANALRGIGLAQGERVIVLMNNSAEMAEVMFGAVRGGLVAVPLNVSVGDEAVAGMIANSEAKAVVASGEHMARIERLCPRLDPALSARLVGIEPGLAGWLDYRAIRDAASPEIGDVRVAPGDECNLIYSSGTTGMPKGIVHSHACREAWASDMAVALRYHSGARTLCNLGLYSNISWVAMLATFFAGGTLCIQRRFAPADCLQAVQDQNITHAAMVPVQYQRLLEYEHFDRYDLSSLQALMCCGSPLSVGLKAEIMQRIPGAFIELYGLTEGLVTILAPEDMRQKIGSVGRPCPGQHLAILDEQDKELPSGEAGEIVGFSRFIMSGYHNNDAANEEATWVSPCGSRWLRTGDIGRIDDDGFLYLVDRKKDMIISGGQNIYPADIEAVLIRHEDVSEVAVIGVASEKWGETPVAVIVPRQGAKPDVDAVMKWANAELGRQQRIAAAVLVDELPRNPNGKILKRDLRRRYASMRL